MNPTPIILLRERHCARGNYSCRPKNAVRYDPFSLFAATVAPAVMTTEAAVAAGATASTAAFLAAPMTVAPATLSIGGIGSALSVLSTAGQLFTGISGRLSEAAQRRAEAKAIENQSKAAAMQKYQEGVVITAKASNIASGSNLVATSGTPLSIMIDNITTASKNAQNVYNQGFYSASQRRAEANSLDNPFALVGQGASVLGDLVRRRYA